LATVYNKASIFFNFGTAGTGKTYYFDDLNYTVDTTPVPVVVPPVSAAVISFDETTPPALIGFGGAEDSTVVADPTNAANKVAKVVKAAGSQVWAGTTVSNLANNAIARIGFSATDKTMTVRVWSPDAGIPVRLKVENAADGTKFVETDVTTTVASGWQTLTFNFANPAAGSPALNLATVYNKASIFFNFGTAGTGKTYYFDDLNYTVDTTTPPVVATSSLPITFDETPAPVLTGFGGAEDATVVADPTNAANKIAKVVKSAIAETWAGTTFSTGANFSIATLPFSATATKMTVRVWTPTAGIPVRLKVETAGDTTRSVETDAITTVANGWETLTFNFANQGAGTAPLNLSYTYNKASIFFNYGKSGAQGGNGTYYFEQVAFLP
jgi:hypothetical protein